MSKLSLAETQKCLEDLLNDHFPDLKNINIVVNYARSDDPHNPLEGSLKSVGLLAIKITIIPGESYFIGLDESLENTNVDIIKGGLAHELAHIVHDLERMKEEILKNRITYRLGYAIAEKFEFIKRWYDKFRKVENNKPKEVVENPFIMSLDKIPVFYTIVCGITDKTNLARLIEDENVANKIAIKRGCLRYLEALDKYSNK